MYEVIESSQVEYQMLVLRDYASERYGSKRMEKLEKEFADCYQRFCTNPYFYQQCFQPKLEAKGYRRAVVQDFIIVYHVDEDRKTVTVAGAFHGRQNYTEYL